MKQEPTVKQVSILSDLCEGRSKLIVRPMKRGSSPERWKRLTHDWIINSTGQIATRHTVDIMRQRGWLKAAGDGWAISAAGRKVFA